MLSQIVLIIGSGSLFILDVQQDGLIPVQLFQWNDGIFDVTWSENNENVLVTAAGDGNILVWDVSQPNVIF